MALFASLIIRLFQLFFAGTVFFSHNKSAEKVFRLVFSVKRTEPIDIEDEDIRNTNYQVTRDR